MMTPYILLLGAVLVVAMVLIAIEWKNEGR